MSGIILLAAILENVTTLRFVQLAAVLSGQVPYGLFFIIIVAYAFGATKIGRARRADPADQRGRVAERRRRAVQRQDRNADHQPADAERAHPRRAASTGTASPRSLGRFAHASGDGGADHRRAARGRAGGDAAATPRRAVFLGAPLERPGLHRRRRRPARTCSARSTRWRPRSPTRRRATPSASTVATLTDQRRRVLVFARNARPRRARRRRPALPPLEAARAGRARRRTAPQGAEMLATFARPRHPPEDHLRRRPAHRRRARPPGRHVRRDRGTGPAPSIDALGRRRARRGRRTTRRSSAASRPRRRSGSSPALVGQRPPRRHDRRRRQRRAGAEEGPTRHRHGERQPAARSIADIVLIGDSFAPLHAGLRRGPHASSAA